MDTTRNFVAAVQAGDVDAVQTLLVQGININDTVKGNNPPLHEAATKGFVKIMGLLITHGANIDAEATAFPNKTPLHLAAENGHVAAVEFLVGHGGIAGGNRFCTPRRR